MIKVRIGSHFFALLFCPVDHFDTYISGILHRLRELSTHNIDPHFGMENRILNVEFSAWKAVQRHLSLHQFLKHKLRFFRKKKVT